MNRLEIYTRRLKWLTPILLAVLVVGCGGGGGKDPILGANAVRIVPPPGVVVPPPGAITPGATCTATAGPTVPRVVASDPVNGDPSASISTAGVAGGGKSVTATFSLAMNAATINSASFTLAPVGGAALIPASVSYDAATQIATLTTSSALLASTTYTAVIQGAVNSAAGTPIGCNYAWTFTTAAAAAPPPPPLAINLGRAASFGIASRAGLTSTGVTVVNGNVALYPTPTCTDSTGNAGASQTCLVKFYTSPTGMTVNGSIFWAGDPFDSGATALGVTTDLNTAWVEGKNKVPTMPTVAGNELSSPISYAPGVYHNATLGLAAGGTATLDANNDANAVWIFQVDSSFVDSGTLLLKSKVVLKNGAQARNVWFVTGLDITIGSGTSWNGNILAGRTATVNDGSTVTGRVLAGASGAGAITLTGAASPSVTTISVPQ